VTVVIAALVTALGAVIVALVGTLASRLETRNARSQLLKDIDISSKLPYGDARKVFERHIDRAVRDLVYQERGEVIARPIRQWAFLGFLVSTAGLVLSFLVSPRHGDYHHLLRELYWITLVFAYLVTGYVVVLHRRGRKKLRELRESATDT
jgi:hypothetical protein